MPSPFPQLPPQLRGTVRTLHHSSEALATNPWSDPADRDVHVYLPPGFSPERSYPVVLILAPFSGTGESLLARGLTDLSMANRIDRLIAADKCAPFIAVMPDVMTSLVGSQFVDSAAIGMYATWIAQELVPWIDSELPTTGIWAVCGRSSGGFGALHLAMKYPGLFRAVASNAGDMGFDLAYLAEIPGGLGPIRAAGGPKQYAQQFWQKSHLSGADFAAMNLLCISAAYSPDATPEDDGFPARLPVDWRTGRVDFDRLQTWKRFDPVHRAQNNTDEVLALRDLKLLYLHAGDRDEYHLQLGAERLVQTLRGRGVAPEYECFSGGHRGTSWRFDVSIPKLVCALTS